MPSNLKNNRITTTDVYINVIDDKTSIEGTVNSEGNMRIDGTFLGNINLVGKLLVGTKGKIEGQINSTDLTLEGFIKGDIKVSNNLIIRSKAKVEGEINAKRIEVELGAELKGQLKIGSTISSKENPQLNKTEQKPGSK